MIRNEQSDSFGKLLLMKKIFPNSDVNLKSISLEYFLIISLLFTYLGELAWFLVSNPSQYYRYTYFQIHVQIRETSIITWAYINVCRKTFSLIFLVTTARVTREKKNTMRFIVKTTRVGNFLTQKSSLVATLAELWSMSFHILCLSPILLYSVIGSLPSWKMSSSGFSSLLTSQA